MPDLAVHFSSQTDDWATPQALFDQLDAEFGFTLDAAASKENAKCARYYTREDDALTRPWEGVVFCNPPYGRVIGHFVRKGALEAAERGGTVVMLIPSRTDTQWWHDYVLPYAEPIRYVRGRLKFGGAKDSAPFPSAVVIFRGDGRAARLRQKGALENGV